MAFGTPPAPGAVIFPLTISWRAVADNTSNTKKMVPVDCRIFGIEGRADFAGGTTPHTDVDLTLKRTGSATTTLASAMAVVESSAAAVVQVTGSGTKLVAGDELELEIDITGGTAPDSNGEVTVWCARE